MNDIVERLTRDLMHILPPTQETWRSLLKDAADELSRLRAENKRLTEERYPRQFKYNPMPWSVVGNANDGYRIADANGQHVLALLWPTHPGAETEAVEEEAGIVADFIAHSSRWFMVTALNIFDKERRAINAEAERDEAIARAEKAEAALGSIRDAWRQNRRDIAVGIVDGVHGYTVEFSAYPREHERQYDAAEEVIDFLLPHFLTEGEGE